MDGARRPAHGGRGRGGFVLAGRDAQPASAHGRPSGPFGFEKVVFLSHVNTVGGWVVVGGVRNEGGSGSPATVFGLVQ